MDFSLQNNNIYHSISRICENVLIQVYKCNVYSQEYQKQYLQKLISKAYSILLKKTFICMSDNDFVDPVVDLLKYTFISKLHNQSNPEIFVIEEMIGEIINIVSTPDMTVYKALQFLNDLKYSSTLPDNLDFFQYGQDFKLAKIIPPNSIKTEFLVYSSKSFYLHENFQSLGVNSFTSAYDILIPGQDIVFMNQFIMPKFVSYTVDRSQFTLRPYYLDFPGQLESDKKHNLKAISKDEKFEDASNGVHQTLKKKDSSKHPKNYDAIHDLINLRGTNVKSSSFVQDNIINNKRDHGSKFHTWESLGITNSKKEPFFMSESNSSILHVINLGQQNILSQKHDIFGITIILQTEFLGSVKLLFLGIESNVFTYSSIHGFEIINNICVEGIPPESLENVSYQLLLWGTCYRNLQDLIVADLGPRKLRIEGLMFKALCSSIRGFLNFYNGVILKLIDNYNYGFLQLIKKMQPVGDLIAHISQLCKCKANPIEFSEGIGILTHIYTEVTKITRHDIALCMYSILKDCCDVYFRFLQQWLFEGLCQDDDIYAEFMIKIQQKYIRDRTHRFWTKAFQIRENAVPGFLSHIVELILQCGKSLMLLKICDPQNPVCRFSASGAPDIKVCLSAKMLREQLNSYDEYVMKGQSEQGKIVSIANIIEEEKLIEKKKTELIIATRKNTLSRLNKEQEYMYIMEIQQKNKRLEELKNQAAEDNLRREKEKNDEVLSNKLFFEEMQKLDDVNKYNKEIDRHNTLKYYSELTDEANKRKLKAKWRMQRMEVFDKRIILIRERNQEMLDIFSPDNILEPISSITDKSIEENENPEIFQQIEDVKEMFSHKVEIKDPETLDQIKTTIEWVDIECRNRFMNTEFDTSLVDAGCEHFDVLNMNTELNLKKMKEGSLCQKSLQIKTLESNSKEEYPHLILDNSTKVEDLYHSSSNFLDNNSFLKELSKTKDSTMNYQVLKSTSLQEDCSQSLSIRQNRPTVLNFNQSEKNKFYLTDAPKNEPKGLHQQFELTPNNNQAINILFNMNSEKVRSRIMPNWNQKGCTEIELNRLRNMQSKLSWIDYGDKELKFTNELEFFNNKMSVSSDNSYDNYSSIENQSEKDLQIGISKNAYGSEKSSTDFFKSSITLDSLPLQKSESNVEESCIQNLKETPMSTTTDAFTLSTHSSTMPMKSNDNTPFSECMTTSSVLAKSLDNLLDGASSLKDCYILQKTLTYTNFIPELNSESYNISNETELTVADVEIIDNTTLKAYLEKSVIIPLKAQSYLVNRSLIQYLIVNEKIVSHLYNLRNYFFLLNGEFAKSLTQSLFIRLYEISNPSELFNSMSLEKILKESLIHSSSTTYINAELLSLTIVGDIPKQLERLNPDVMNCLSLNYKITWPVNIILSDLAIRQYSKVFKFLLTIGRVLWVLQEDFQILKFQKSNFDIKYLHKLQLYRHSMMQFMNAFHTYITCTVLHASWSEFEKALVNSKTLDEICKAHVCYIKKILSRCMLNEKGEKIRKVFYMIFKLVLSFHHQIKEEENRKHTSYQNKDFNSKCNEKVQSKFNYSTQQNYDEIYNSFYEQRAYLALLVKKNVNRGYQPNLIAFLDTLNINQRYDFKYKNRTG